MNIEQTYQQPCDHPGTLEVLCYPSNSYDEKQIATEKKALIYLPYDYNSAKSYNVVYLMHGGGGNHEEFFGGLEAKTVLKPMLDHMIEDGIIDPLIVVTPTFYHVGTDHALRSPGDAMFLTENYHQELMKDLIPAVEANYAAASGREHRAFGGFSMGSEATWNVFGRCLKDFKYFLPMCGDYWVVQLRGGLECPVETVDHLVRSVQDTGCDFYIAACVGDQDIAYKAMDSLLQEMKKRPEFTDVFYYVEPQGIHSYDFVFKYIRNALPLFFQ